MSIPTLKDIVLLGGGHSHALLIRRWAMNPLAGVRLTLISQDVLTPYSGMLPGYIAGHYTSDDIHIDLSMLCRWANIRFIEATITGLNLPANKVLLANRPDFGYDVLSIDTGSTPETGLIKGAAEHAIPVKPINQLQHRWLEFVDRLDTSRTRIDIAVVGSGVGGFELLTALDHSLKTRGHQFRLHWILRGQVPIKSRPDKAQRLALKACEDKGIQVHTGFDVSEVVDAGIESVDGRMLRLDEVFWCTAAAASKWPGQAGLQTDDKGFIATNAYLQSISHSDVFATGDIATQIESPSEKAGVFAVRQAPVLFKNLRNYVANKPLTKYSPQKETLSLMALGDKSAIATRGRFTLSGDWVWRWKDHIDRSFMEKFSILPAMSDHRWKWFRKPAMSLGSIPAALRAEANIDAHSSAAAMRCGGCGAKVPANILQDVMQQLKPVQRDDVMLGIYPPNDSAVIRTAGQAMAQSVDQFRAMLDDPYLFGRIAALHALSDLFAMSAEAQSAQALVSLPHAADAVLERDLFQLMAGALLELNRHNCALVGGHTSEGAEMSFGFAVNGWLPKNVESSLLQAIDQSVATLHSSMQAGEQFILTKAIGTGVLLNADMQGKAKGVDMQLCIQSMLLSNAVGAEILSPYCSAMTDVTGFGLLGHLLSLTSKENSALDFDLHLNAIPLLPGARMLTEAGAHSTLLPANLRFLKRTHQIGIESQELNRLICDPQTSGGLLASVPAASAEACVDALVAAGCQAAAIIGEVRSNGSGVVNLCSARGVQA